MRTPKQQFICLLLPMVLLSACAKPVSNNATVETISASAIADSNLPPAEKAEQFALAAEKLLTAQGFSQANDFAQQALQLDATNFRGQLIVTILSPLVLQRGVLTRLKKIMSTNPDLAKEYTRVLGALTERLKSRHVDEFFNADDASVVPFANEAELQMFIKKVATAMEQIRVFSLKSRSKTITVRANAFLIPDLNARYIATCELQETGDREYQLTCPPSENRMMVTMNQGEFELIKDAVTYFESLLVIPASYSLTGLAAEFNSEVPTSRQAAEKYAFKVLDLPTFGVLNDSSRMTAMRGWMLDLVSGLRWAMQNQSSLCPQQYSDAANRPGYLFNKGVCVHPFFSPYLDRVSDATTVKAQAYHFKSKGHSQETQINPLIFFMRPVAKLSALGPIRLTEVGGIDTIGDETMAGVFPNRDASFVLRSASEKGDAE